ncbi:metal-dependent hydrolase [Candidatus Woesearchaeota archaeon]|nr:metal-dependent hydrolase [Candidatus Woesearchaeota archaeon]
MAFGFGHLIIAWLTGKLVQGASSLRHAAKVIKLTRIEWALLLFGAILPDADHLVDWTLGTNIHRVITHSIVFAGLVGLLVAGLAVILKKKYPFFSPIRYGLLIGLGVLTHIAADMAAGHPGVGLLWPLQGFTYFFGYVPSYATTMFVDNIYRDLQWAIFDIGLGAAWLGYFVIRDKIQF